MRFQSAALATALVVTVLHPWPGCDSFALRRNIQTSKPARALFRKNTSSSTATALFAEGDDAAPVPAAGHTITTTNDGPGVNGGTVHTLTINLGDASNTDPLVIQTGKIGRQASGSVTLTRGETILYSTACRDKDPRPLDFLPLSVEYQERFSSAGITKGGFNKRDGRPAEHETLTCRLIDRPLRPLIMEGWRHETQLLSWVLSYDGLIDCSANAITSSAAALWLSDVPLLKPVAAAHVGYIDDQFVLNPTHKQMERSRLDLTMAGTKDAVLMIEGAADFLPEKLMVDAVAFGHASIKTITAGLEELSEIMGITKITDTIEPPVEGLDDAVNDLMSAKMEEAFGTSDKSALSATMSAMSKLVVAELTKEDRFPDKDNAIRASFKKMQSRVMYEHAKATGERIDGRKLNQVRHIDIDSSILPSVHGSALFTRGETQTIATATLGDASMKQKIDKLDGTIQKNFYLQYTFPPSCVGETGRVGNPGRREIGHGNLAERAIVPALPSITDFPYSIRVESLITESNGSSSMASVCGGSLALLDAGVPLKSPVAGIAMGMLLNDKQSVSDADAIIVSDILGTEDALGTMDFKVAGDREGITTFQLDIKCEGLSLATMERALDQAKEGRLHILDEMDKCLSEPRSKLPDTVPKLQSFDISQDSIGKVIGPGGKQIRAIIEDFGLTNMNVDDEGCVQITGLDTDKLEEAEKFIKKLVEGGGRGGGGGGGGGREKPKYLGEEQPVEGKTYKGKITGIHQFGVFVEILPGAEDGSSPGLEGLCHISELHSERVRDCEGFIKALGVEEIDVQYVGQTSNGKLRLSRKATLAKAKPKTGVGTPGWSEGSKPNTSAPPNITKVDMAAGELNAIAQAIAGIGDDE